MQNIRGCCPGSTLVALGLPLQWCWEQPGPRFPFRPLTCSVAHPEWFPMVLGRVKSLNNAVFNSGCPAPQHPPALPPPPTSTLQNYYLKPCVQPSGGCSTVAEPWPRWEVQDKCPVRQCRPDLTPGLEEVTVKPG